MSPFRMGRIGGVMRVIPTLNPTAFTTFQLIQPSRTHFRPASCAEIECPHYVHGWISTVPAGSKEEWACRNSRRGFTETKVEGNLIRFHFYAGQPCFKYKTHEKFLEREALHIVRQGDWRWRGQGKTHTKPEFWREEFSEHQDKLNKVING